MTEQGWRSVKKVGSRLGESPPEYERQVSQVPGHGIIGQGAVSLAKFLRGYRDFGATLFGIKDGPVPLKGNARSVVEAPGLTNLTPWLASFESSAR